VGVRLRLVPILVAVALAGCASLPAAAPAAAGLPAADIDCNANARLTHQYTIAQLQQALAQMPADMRAYSDCPDVIRRQLLIQLGKLRVGDSGGGSGGSFLPVWLIVVLALLAAGASAFGVLALRRRASS